MQNQIRFIISLFGDRHVGMLLPLLYSIKISNPQADISVYWEDIQPKTIRLLQTAFPQTEWRETQFNFSKDVTKRISSKILVWNLAAQEKKWESGWLLFLDADMLVRKDIFSYINQNNCDGILTYRDGKFPLNSGVVAFRAGEATAQFFLLWLEKTQEILQTPSLFAQANDKHLPFGGADQMSLHLLLSYRIVQREYQISLEDKTILLRTVPCEHLNETYSAPLTDDTRIIHYKGGWRSILFEGGPFTRNRPKKTSWDMFVYYHRIYREAISFLNQATASHFMPEIFGLTTPFYFNPLTFRERPGLYPLFWLSHTLRTFFPRLRHYLKNRLAR